MAGEKLPTKMDYDGGYLPDTGRLDDAKLTPSLRSFMDKGETVFANEPYRASQIDGVRQSILANLRQENRDSLADTLRMRQEHALFSQTEMMPLIDEVKEAIIDARLAKANHLVYKARLGGQNLQDALTDVNAMMNAAMDDRRDAKARLDARMAAEKSEKDRRAQQRANPAIAGPAAGGVPVAGGAADVAVPAAVPGQPQGDRGARDDGQEDEEDVAVAARLQDDLDESEDELEAGASDIEEIPDDSEESEDESGASSTTRKRKAGRKKGSGKRKVSAESGGKAADSAPVRGAPGAGAVPLAPAGGPPPALGAAAGAGPAPAGVAAAPQGPFETEESVAARNDFELKIGAIQTQIMQERGKHHFFNERREKSARDKEEAARQKAGSLENSLRDNLRRKAEEWDRRRNRHRETTFRDHYRQYDSIAESYYRFTRGLQGNPQRDLQTNANTAKEIAEYIGVYDQDQFNGLATRLDRNPYENVRFRLKKYKDIGAGSKNTASPDGLVKFHKTIVMEAFGNPNVQTLAAEEASGAKRTRLKVLNDFRAYTAKRQYTDANRTALRVENSQLNATEKSAPVPVDTKHPVADERGANGEYLISEKSAAFHDIGNEYTGETIGVYDNGRFYADDDTAMTRRDAQVTPVSSKALDRIEEMRRAVRRSDFFHHINSGTIQHYMTYDPDDDFSRQAAIAALNSVGLRRQYSPAYRAMLKLHDYKIAAPGAKAREMMALKVAASTATLFEDEENIRKLGIALLAEEDPQIWEVAREMVRSMKGKSGFRTLTMRLNDLPETGQVMRMALMEEFSRDRRTKWDELETYTDPISAFRPDFITMAMEDATAKRGDFLSKANFLRSLADGSFLAALTGEFSPGAAAVKRSDFRNGNLRYAENLEKLTAQIHSLGEDVLTDVPPLITDFSDFFAPESPKDSKLSDATEIASGAPENETSETKEEGMDSLRKLQFASSLYTGAKSLVKFIYQCKELHDRWRESANEQRIEGLFEIFETLVEILDSIAEMIDSFCKTIVSAQGLSALALIKDTVAIIKDSVTIIRTIRERNRITASERYIDTAMSLGTPLGAAAARNYQGREFLEMARQRAKQAQITAGSGLIKHAVQAAGEAVALDSTVKQIDPRILPFTLAGKVVGFVGWCVGKGFERSDYKRLIANALGDESFADLDFQTGMSGAFDEVLKHETGIQNNHYLPDVARIFTAIDTHNLARKGNRSPGDTALVLSLMAPYLKMAGEAQGLDGINDPQNLAANDSYARRVNLNKLLEAVGAPGNWRSVLRYSITG